MARISLNEAMGRPAEVDRAKLDATTEEDIRRYQAEDGFADIDVGSEARTVIPPRQLRVGLGLTQREMAARLRVPFDTWRNWETGRVRLDPAVRSLLDLVAAFGTRAFEALEGKALPPIAEPGKSADTSGYNMVATIPALSNERADFILGARSQAPVRVETYEGAVYPAPAIIGVPFASMEPGVVRGTVRRGKGKTS